MKKPPQNNFAFIDIQNVTMRLRDLGRDLDWRKFHIYLKEKYHTTKAFIFIGYISRNKYFYDFLRSCGYILIFKPVIGTSENIKANCDGDMILFVISKIRNYNKAIIVTSDGDFYSTVRFLQRYNKLGAVISANTESCSRLLKREAKGNIFYLNDLKKIISRELNEKAPQRDGTQSHAFSSENLHN